MIQGRVRDYLPRVRLTLPGTSDEFEVEFIVDTGFEGDLALPHALAMRLAANVAEERFMLMADGVERLLPVRFVTLEWHDEERVTEVLEVAGNPLLGMMLLNNSHLDIEAINDGEVLIEPL